MPPSLPPTQYRIVPLDPNAHLYEVSVTVVDPDPAGQCFRLPSWIPGSYLIREFARHFVLVRAEAESGEIRITKEAKDVWRAAPCFGPLTVVAQVYAFDLSVRGAYLDATRGYFNGATVFLCPVGREEAPCTVDIAPPDAAFGEWKVATTLPAVAAAPYGFGRFRAGNFDELIDHPVETGSFATATFMAGGTQHDIAVTGQQQSDLPRLASDLRRICQWHIDLFGGAPDSVAPVDHYLFQVMAVGEGYGGLEHRASTSLICRREDLPKPGVEKVSDSYLGFLGLASHEYFHTWNIKRIKPEAFSPYDLTRENYTRQLWAFEGITSYYDDLALVRCGLIPPARYLELVGRAISSVLRNPGRNVQSVAESSFDAWIKYYRRDENTPNAVVSYYVKGSLVALCLDLTLRSRSSASLDDLMRALWLRHGHPGIGVPENAIEKIASEMAGEDLGDFFTRYVFGTEDLPLSRLLAEFGIALHMRPATGSKDRGGKAAAVEPARNTLGAQVAGDLKLTHVLRGGPASRAGLAAGDTLVAIDDLKATHEMLESLMDQPRFGKPLVVHAFRRDELRTFRMELDAAPLDTAYLVLDENPGATSAARRDAWLGSRG
ncbi:MAG: PDZ domain-containing protein [Betaproteobacteria bacterium]